MPNVIHVDHSYTRGLLINLSGILTNVKFRPYVAAIDQEFVTNVQLLKFVKIREFY